MKRVFLGAVLFSSLIAFLASEEHHSVHNISNEMTAAPAGHEKSRQEIAQRGNPMSELEHSIPNSSDEAKNHQEKDESFNKLKEFVVNQALQMNRLQSDPGKINKELNIAASKLSESQARRLLSIAKDSAGDQNQRAIALDLLSREAQRNQGVLVEFLSRTDFPKELRIGLGGHHNSFENFEYALSLKALRSLERNLQIDIELKRSLLDLIHKKIPEVTKGHIVKSLASSFKGRSHWNEVASSMKKEDKL